MVVVVEEQEEGEGGRSKRSLSYLTPSQAFKGRRSVDQP